MDNLEKLADVHIIDLDEKAVRVGDLWQKQTTVLVFIRHFG